MAATPLLLAYKALFTVLGCLMVATLGYALVTDGSPFRRELLTPWMTATLVDFYVNVVALSVWVFYDETTWIGAVLWIILLVCFGSITTCTYIVKKLCDIQSQDPVKGPVRDMILRIGCERNMKSSIAFLKFLFIVLGLLVLAVVVYTLITDGFPFRMELLTPWMAATLIDFYINVFAISVWVAHKESTWIATVIWIVLLICFGSIATCSYIIIQLFRLSSQDPNYRVLLNAQASNQGSSTS